MKTILIFLCSLLLVCPGFAKDKQPNVVLFLVDDMGWMDSTPYGSKYYETPNICNFIMHNPVSICHLTYSLNPIDFQTR